MFPFFISFVNVSATNQNIAIFPHVSAALFVSQIFVSMLCLCLLCVCVFPTKYLKLIQYKLAYKYFNFIIIFGSETFTVYSTHYNLYVIFILRTKR